MSRVLKVAFWPEERKVGGARIQRSFNCDPIAATLFPSDMVTMKILDSPVYIWEATEAEWKKMAVNWARLHTERTRWKKHVWIH